MLLSDKRITPNEVKQAYVDTDMVPQHATMHEVRELDQFSGARYPVPQHCGCAFGTLFRQRTGFYHNENPNGAKTHDAYDWAIREYGNDYVDGFILGFDAYVCGSEPHSVRTPGRTERFYQAFDDGQAVGCACYPVVRP